MNTTNLAIFAGLIASDGHLDKDYSGIRFITSNKRFLESICKLVNVNKFKIWKTKSGFGKDRYILYIYDQKLKDLLENKYKIPRGKKSEIIDIPDGITYNEKTCFIKGLFSGDGSISYDTKKNKKYPQIIMWSKSKNLLQHIQEFFNKLDIKCGISCTKAKNQYRLTIRKRNSLQIFKKFIGFVHPEKQKILNSLT